MTSRTDIPGAEASDASLPARPTPSTVPVVPASAPTTDPARRAGLRIHWPRRVRGRRALAAGVFVVVAAATVTTTLVAHSVSTDQQRRLLSERAHEVEAFLQSSGSLTSAALSSVADSAAVPGRPNFQARASMLTSQGATALVVRRTTRGAFVTVAALGSGAAPGRALTSGQQLAAARALTEPSLIYQVIPVGGVRHLYDAIHVQAAVPTVAILDTALPRNVRAVVPSRDSPYRELDVAVYVGSRLTPADLVIVSGATPSPADDDTVTTRVSIGSDHVTVVTAARGSLIGGLAAWAPWIVLGIGLVLGVLLALLVDVLARRRAEILDVVEQRTRELSEARETAEAANRSKSEFLSRMSHELRTPLNAVLGFGQVLELEELTDSQRRSVEQITRGGRHLLGLINEILDITQIEAGKMQLSPEPVQVSDLVDEAIELVRPLADERHVHLLAARGNARGDFVFADRQRAKQILLNLLGNAIKYNRDGGTVSVTCVRSSAGAVRMQVTDTGPGIAPNQLGRLFVPFERLGSDSRTEGSGIGLSLSRRLAEAMDGRLEVDSLFGHGSTFWLELALAEHPVNRLDRSDIPSTPAPPGRARPGPGVAADTPRAHEDTDTAHDVPATAAGDDRPAVLLIEDNLANTQLVERVLEQRPDVALMPTMQGRIGLDLARQHNPALILLDLNLPDVSGETVLRELREDATTTDIPIVVLSADAMPRQAQRLIAAGADDYLTKPVDVRRLLELIEATVPSA